MKQYHKNPRQITKKQFADLQKWLAELGDLSGVVHDLNSDEIIGGNQRSQVFNVNACAVELVDGPHEPDEQGTVAHGFIVWQGKRYGYRQVRWTEKQCEQANIVANKAGGAWDWDGLANGFEFGDLLEWGFSEEELTGLDFGAQDDAGGGGEPSEIAPDRFEEMAAKWGTADGQLWRAGEHLILCGDSLDLENVRRLFGESGPALVIADPPYGVSIVTTNGYVGGGEAYNIPFGGRKKGYVGGGNSIKDRTGHYPIEGWKNGGLRGTDGAAHLVEVGKYPEIIGDDSTDTAERAVALYCEMYPNAIQVWWGANYYSPVLPASQCWIVWNKETTGNFADCELAWTNMDKAARLFTHRWNGMLRDSERERRWHPTQKPAALAAWVYTEFTEDGALIFDPFAGAGWSVLAAQMTGRKARVIEKSHEYIAVILERLSQMGLTPELVQ